MAIKGIDVSGNNGTIDWNKVKKDDIKFAILRCGYGMDMMSQDDSQYEKNISECERLKIPYGIYIFSYANTVEKAKSEAQHTLRLVKGYKKPVLGIWYDIEDNKTSGAVGKTTLTNIINTYCNIIKNAGYDVGIYANKNWLDNKIEKQIKNNYQIWVAQYNNKCTYEGKYVIWQYSSKGKVNGIKGNVDMNYLYNGNLLKNGQLNTIVKNTTKGTKKDRIKSLQTSLNKDFNCELVIDGIIGKLTTKAIKSHYLKYYTSGNFVKWVQTQLKRKGYDIGKCGIDGRYGKDTEKAVKKYQKAKGLTIDSCVGIETVKSLIS